MQVMLGAMGIKGWRGAGSSQQVGLLRCLPSPLHLSLHPPAVLGCTGVRRPHRTAPLLCLQDGAAKTAGGCWDVRPSLCSALGT